MPAKKKRSKKKTGATRNPERGTSKLTLAVVVLLVGSFAAFLLYLDKIPIGGNNPAALEKQSPVKKTKTGKSLPPKHKFDFYTVLPDREIEIIDVEEQQTQRNVTPPSATKQQPKAVEKKLAPQTPGLYQLQVGAFKELSKADAMKARLAFIGVESNIQVIQRNGQKMYRVRVGPSTDSQKINRIKNQLKAQNIKTFVQKLSG